MFKIEFETGNAAFEEYWEKYNVGLETARILKKAAEDMEEGRDCGLCVDYNGNTVGKWSLEFNGKEA